MSNFWKKLLNALYPEGITCDLCGNELTDKDDRSLGLCAYCYGRMKIVQPSKRKFGGCDVYSLFAYDSVRELVLRSKDNDMPYLTKTMARLLARFYKNESLSTDVVCYVPSSKKNYERRGYDHVKYVAEEFCSLTGLPLKNALIRVKDSSDQTQVDVDKRYENVRGGFECTMDLTDRRVLLLDDLVTTGATLTACLHALKNACPKEIICLTLARAGE